ncbi:hypothetical protein Bhyg_12237 [Pseudolycoriella hygida]|uniref:Uncharacterized protein n=1 Tax=Pseudolycoriella hygida TaxID=35572 RepID=A0A9Q0MWU2_9DIPT|nr:hypothetical protein Bhyg_12237 [Pseudolycoriella hygida]
MKHRCRCSMPTVPSTKNSAYNLNIHMKSAHKLLNDRYVKETTKRKMGDTSPGDDVGPKEKQMKLDVFHNGGLVNQEKVDQMILNYIIDKVLPFSTVENKSFKELVLTGKSHSMKVMTRLEDDPNDADEDKYEDDSDELTMLLADTNRDIFLPPHDRCSSHSLCLVLTSDIKVKKLRQSKKGTHKRKQLTAFETEFNDFRVNTLDPVLKKCQDLFNMQSKSSKAADLIHSFLNRYLVVPSATKWNSLYDSVTLLSTLLDDKPEEMTVVMTGLSLEKISSRDHDVLKEYIKITENVADALDVLQGEVYMYQGVFSPTIHKMTQKINGILDLKYCTALKQRILESIEKRFSDYMKDDYLKATLLHPIV